MVDSIKISDLTYANGGDLSPTDQFIVNDMERSDDQTITRRTDLKDIIGYFTSLPLTFSNLINFQAQVNFNDAVAFDSTIDFNDYVYFNQPVQFMGETSFRGDIFVYGEITGVELDDLDDVDALGPGNGQVLTWNTDTTPGKWIPKTISGTTPEGDDRYLVHVGETPPNNAVDGMLWLHTVTATNSTRALKVYATISGVSKWYLTRPDGLLLGDGLPTDRTALPATTAIAAASVVPSTSSSSGTPGEYASDDSYFYFCVSPNTWIKTSTIPF